MLRNKHKKTIKAFTLIELLVSMVIVSIMLFISVDTTIRLVRQGEKSDIRSEIDRGVNYSLETIKRNVIQASLRSIKYCSAGVTNCISVSGDKQFKLSNNKILQCNGTPTNPCATSFDLTGSSVFVSSLDFTVTDLFVEINLKVYDTNQLVYTNAKPLSIVTGALIRN